MKRRWLAFLSLALAAVFCALGAWQIQRLHWKQALIERTQRNTEAPVVQLSSAGDFSRLTAPADEYLRVRLTGAPDCTQARAVWAATRLGTGYWWMVPVRLTDNAFVWLNRGYVNADSITAWRKQAVAPAPAATPSGATRQPLPEGEPQVSLPGLTDADSCRPGQFEGLLRMSQTGGGFLRPNDPSAGRWYSRDVAALSASAAISAASEIWFVDEGYPPVSVPMAQELETLQPTDRPVAGLTPLQWPNKHLGYAMTWFALALASAGLAVLSLRAKV